MMKHHEARDQRWGAHRTNAGRQGRRMRPTVMALEDRRLLSTFTVESTLDDGSVGTLRWAVEEANSTAGANTIDFDSTVFSTPKSITLSGSQLELSNTDGTATVTGPAAGVTVSGGGLSRVFQVDGSVEASISGLTITGGNADSDGGGLFNSTGATATLTDCSFSGNSAASSGGGIYSGGATTLTDCTLSGNSARLGGGLDSIAGNTTLINTNVSENVATASGGGLATVNGSTTLTKCTVSDNSAANGAGGLFIYGGETTLTDCTVSRNSAADGSGGGVDQNRGTTTLTNCILGSNSASFGGGGLFDGHGTTALSDCTLSGNSTVGVGGGLATTFYGTATLTNCTVSGNSAIYGGGLTDLVYSATTLTNCTISGNSASINGGGLFSNSYYGMSLTNCTISGNSASENGGGLFIKTYYATTLTNCTVSGNSAPLGNGGGLYNYGLTTLTDTTVSRNTAMNGGGLDNASGTVTIGNVIVAENAADTSGPDVLGAFASQGNDLIGETDDSSGWIGSDLTGTIALPTYPLLASLGNYGGPTETMPPLPGSPAIDTGSNSLIPDGVTTDQRGLPRIVNSVVDIGAFESSGFSITVRSGSGQSTGVLTAFPAPLVLTVTPNNVSEPVAGGLVTFTAPTSGASATLSGSPATISATGTSTGDATANGIDGGYAVTVTASGIMNRASFHMTNSQLIIALDPTAAGALRLSGNASITTSGVVYVDSNSSVALFAIGNARIKAAAIDVHGGVRKIGNASFSPSPVTGAPVLAVASLTSPSTTGMTNFGSVKLRGNTSETIQPGIYGEISVSGNAELTLSAGIYIIEGGGFSVSGNASIIGAGVMVVNAGSEYPINGGSYSSIVLKGTGTFSLSPATSGTYAGITFFQPTDNTMGLVVTGDTSEITGTIYAPAAKLSETGNGALRASLVVDALSISGNSTIGASSKLTDTVVTGWKAGRDIPLGAAGPASMVGAGNLGTLIDAVDGNLIGVSNSLIAQPEQATIRRVTGVFAPLVPESRNQ